MLYGMGISTVLGLFLIPVCYVFVQRIVERGGKKTPIPAAATAAKGAQKAALKDKAEGHAADLAMGLTSTMKKAMAGDTLLCSVCGATTRTS